MVGVLAHGHVRQQARPGQALLDRLGEPLGDHDVRLTVGAGVLGPDVLEHDERRGHIFELLAEFLADRPALDAALRAEPLFGRDVVRHPPTRQARRQGLAAVAGGLGFRGGLVRGCRSGSDLGPAGLGDLLREEPELAGVELLALPAVEPAEDLFELVLEVGVEVGLLAERGEQLADEPVGTLDVLGQRGVGIEGCQTAVTGGGRRCDKRILNRTCEIYGIFLLITDFGEPCGILRVRPRSAGSGATRGDTASH